MQCDLCMCTCEQCPVSNVICACVRPAMGRRAGSASAPSAVTAGAHFCTSAICIGAIGSQPSELHHTQIALLHFLICQHICTDGMLAFSNFSVSINIEVVGKKVAWVSFHRLYMGCLIGMIKTELRDQDGYKLHLRSSSTIDSISWAMSRLTKNSSLISSVPRCFVKGKMKR